MKERHVFTLNRFLGIDLSTFPTKTHKSRAVSGINFITEYGALKKRNGWKEVKKFSKPITGAITFGEYIVIRSGNKFYLCSKDYEERFETINYPNGDAFILEAINDEKCSFFQMDDTLYVIGVGKYLMIYQHGVNDANEPIYAIDEVKHHAFVPTTTISIDDVDSLHKSQASLEKTNRLTRKRKNTLIGRTGTNLRWLLDGSVRFETVDDVDVLSEVTVEIEHFSSETLNAKRYKNLNHDIYLYDENETNFTENKRKGELYRNYLGSEHDYFWERITKAQYDMLSKLPIKSASFNGYIPNIASVEAIEASEYSLWDQYGSVGMLVQDEDVAELSLQATNLRRFLKESYGIPDIHFGGGYNEVIYCRFNKMHYVNTAQYGAPNWVAIFTGSTYPELVPNLYYVSGTQVFTAVNYTHFDMLIDYAGEQASEIISSKGKTYYQLMQSTTFNPKRVYGGVKIYEDTTPLIEGADNITIAFENYADDLSISIEKSLIGVIFGVNGTDNQLFLTGDDAVEYYTQAYDFTYFPDSHVNTVGNKKNRIVGYSRLSDTSMVVYKDNKVIESRLYFRSMSLSTNETYVTTEYLLYDRAIDVGIGCDAPSSIANLLGDTVFLSRQGVYAVTLGDHISVEARHVRERSAYINARLTKENISQAKAIVFDNRYYLAIDETVYVADSRYISSAELADTFNYEWFMWDNTPVKEWFIIDNKLCFSDEEGRMCEFDDAFSDRTKIYAKEGQAVADGNKITYDGALEIKENDLIRVHTKNIYEEVIPNGYIGFSREVTQDGATYTEFETWINIDPLLLDGDVVYIRGGEGFSLEPYQLFLVDDFNFYLVQNGQRVYNADTSFSVQRPLFEKEIMVTNLDTEAKEFQLKKYVGGTPIAFLTEETNAITFDITVHRSVKMLWYSAVMDMGTNMYTKSLLAMTLSADGSTDGQIKFGFDTRNISLHLSSLNFKAFDFNDIDFNNFTFLTAIVSSQTVRVKEKDFNFIVFKISCETPTAANINDLTIMYKINQMNRGIR